MFVALVDGLQHGLHNLKLTLIQKLEVHRVLADEAVRIGVHSVKHKNEVLEFLFLHELECLGSRFLQVLLVFGLLLLLLDEFLLFMGIDALILVELLAHFCRTPRARYPPDFGFEEAKSGNLVHQLLLLLFFPLLLNFLFNF